MAEAQLVSPGSCCLNPGCPDYGRGNGGSLRRFGKTAAGRQRYQCRTCGVTFTETKGTLFYGCRTPQATILECLALVAERASLAAIHRVKGVKEETVAAWLEKAADHVEQLEASLLAHYSLTRAQLDALWSFVGHKGEKGGTPRRNTAAPSGAASPSSARRACGSGGRSPRTKPPWPAN